MHKFVAVVAAGLAIGVGGMALADDFQLPAVAPAAVTPAAVIIDNFAFGPGKITVKAGTAVTWTNRDDDVHTVVNTATATPLFKSGALDTNDTFSFTFDKPGTYEYLCSVHPRMTGAVVVE